MTEPEHGDAALLSRELGQPDNTVLIRALLRRRGDPHEVLTELTRLLHLPAAVPELLDGRLVPNQLPGARWVEPASVWLAVLKPPRGLVRFLLVCAIVAGVAFAVSTLIGVLVLASDGAAIEQEAVTADDVVGTIVTGTLTVAALGVVMLCRRRLARWQ